MSEGSEVRVGIYARLSQDRDEEATSTKRQAEDCRQLAESRGWTVAGEYVDRGISGYSGATRPEFDRLIADLKAGRIDGVVAWKLDRLSRNRLDWHRLAELVDHGATLAAVHDPVDTSSPLGTVVVDLLASMARAESANSSTRIRRAMEERARAGKPHATGGRVFGYTADYQLEPDEAAAARDAAERVLAGDSLASIAKHLNRKGIYTAEGNEWSGVTLGRTLRSPTLAGIRTHRGEHYPGTWPAAIDRETWERMRATLDRRAMKYTPGGRTRVHLLSALLHCGSCGTVMHGHRKPNGVARYRCVRGLGGCGRTGILTDGVDGFVRDAVLAALDGPGLAAAIRRRASDAPDTSELVVALDAAEAQLEQLADDFGNGTVSRSEWLTAREAVVKRIERLRRQLSSDAEASTLTDLSGVDLAAWWGDPGTTNERRRALLDAVVESVEIGPMRRGGSGWDPERVTIHWRT